MAKDENDKQTTIKRRPFSSNGRVQSSSGGGETSFYDASDFYANYHGNFIQFTSVIDGSSVKFKAFLTAFDDQFSSEWNSEQVYGRNDPIQTFQGTTRKIQIDWDCPAGSIWEAKTNMANAALLVRMLYPGYLRRGNVSTLNRAPLIKVKFRNLIKGYENDDLLVTIDGVNFSPDLEAGFFDHDESVTSGAGSETWDELMPKLLRFSCSMTVLHKKTIGFNGLAQWPDDLKSFPNVPKSLDVDDWSLGGSLTFGNPESQEFLESQTSFNEEEEAAQAELESAQEAQGDLETSDTQKEKQSRKANRQARRAQKTEDKIKKAESAAWQEESRRGGYHGTGAQAANARDRQGLSYEGQKYRKRKTK
mgnify:CR=1 FL=1